MSEHAPHFLLYADVGQMAEYDQRGWRFVLHAQDGAERLEASDVEENMARSRLELLSVIRGLEALDQPSHVTLVTSSRYVGSGLHHGLEQWRQTDYQWDEFGVMTPIKNEDLWRRLDRALRYHEVDCRVRKGRGVPPDLAVQFRVERGCHGTSALGALDTLASLEATSAGPAGPAGPAERRAEAATEGGQIGAMREPAAVIGEPATGRMATGATAASVARSERKNWQAPSDPATENWPRRKKTGHRFVAALGTVAAAVAVVLVVAR